MASLAARCTACATVFRVVPDQLRVAGGLVRCGRCSEVFNAAESLIDLETGSHVEQPAPEPTAAVQAAAPEPGTDFDLQIAPPAADPVAEQPRIAEADLAAFDPTYDTAGLDRDTEQMPVAEAANEPVEAPTQASIEGLFEEPPPDTVARAAQDHPDLVADPRAESGDQPSFVRSAERAQRWRSPRMRAALVALALLATLLLGGQVAHSYRDLIAARWPQTLPALQALCGALACRVEPPRSIESLAVESSGLVRVEKSRVYKLQVALRNRAAMAVAVPALDLTLSDAQGKPIARRVLRAAELGVSTATLAGGRELALQATLQAATEPVAGYTIELFYP